MSDAPLTRPRGLTKTGAAWIAFNDSSGDGSSVREISEYVTTAMLADLMNVEPLYVARCVARVRRAHGLEVGEE